MRKSRTSAVQKNPVIRRQILQEFSDGKYSPYMLFHMVHHDQAANTMVKLAKELGRPIDAVDIGTGEGWPLKILISGMMVKKGEVLRSFTGVDILETYENPFGPQLREQIQFRFITQDMGQLQPLDIVSASMDFVNCTEFLEHIGERPAKFVLGEIHRILRTGGTLYLTTPNDDNSSHSDQYHIYEWPMLKLLMTMGSIGFSVKKIVGTYIEKRKFDKVNAVEHEFPDALVEQIRNRFTSNWQRVLFATPYPEHSEGIAILAVKR